jgi:hypothetical protein
VSDEYQYRSGYCGAYDKVESILDQWTVSINTKHVKMGTRELTDSEFDLLREFFNCVRADISTLEPPLLLEAKVVAPPAPTLHDLYASYANHCAIQNKVPDTWHTWKRRQAHAAPGAKEPKAEE